MGLDVAIAMKSNGIYWNLMEFQWDFSVFFLNLKGDLRRLNDDFMGFIG